MVIKELAIHLLKQVGLTGKVKRAIDDHIGGVGSVHNISIQNGDALMNQEQHLETVISRQTEAMKKNYHTLLNASIDCIRFLLRQGLAFRNHDESMLSNNTGNFLELLQFLADHNERVKDVAFQNAPGNLQFTSLTIQKDIINAVAVETIHAIRSDIGNAPFYILVDEARDNSVKEQMAVVIRYVDSKGQVIERFMGVEHVTSTDAQTLKLAIDELFSRKKLRVSSLRGQGYDGASNMQGVTNDLSHALQRKDQDIVNVIDLVKACKQQLQKMREDEREWDNLLKKVYTFCGCNDIEIPNMDDIFVAHGKSKQKAEKITMLHHYRMEVFCSVIDKQLSDLNDWFDEVNTELLVCVASLNPDNSYDFDKQKLLNLAKFYPRDFSERDVLSLESMLNNYINDMRSNNAFCQLK